MVDDAILQQSLAQVNPFLRVSCLTNFHQPRHNPTTPEARKHTAYQIQLPHEEASNRFNLKCTDLCSCGQKQCGELPFVNTSLNNKLVQNYMKTKCLNENNQAQHTDNTCA